MNTSRSRLLIGSLSLTWVIIITCSYYVTHKPFDVEFALRFGEIVLSISSGLVFVSASSGIGSWFVPIEHNKPATRAFMQLAFGAGILGLLMLSLGSTLGIIIWLEWGILLIIILYRWKHILAWWSCWRNIPELWIDSGALGQIIGIGLALGAFLTLGTALSPPMKFDALVYHLPFAKVYADTGRISFQPNFFWGMPQLGEMLFTWVISIAGIQSASVLGWLLSWFSVLGLLSFASEFLGETPAWVTAVALVSGYSLLSSMPAAYVDWLAIFWGIATLIALQGWVDRQENHMLSLAGCFTGFTLGTKYSSGVLLVACVVIIVLGRKKWSILPALFRYVLFSLITFSPWLIKNVVATGNPVYPFLFPSGVVDPIRLNLYQIEPDRAWQDIFLLPFRATFVGLEGGAGYSASIGPLMLALAPLAFFLHNKTQKPTFKEQVFGTVIWAGLAVWIIAAQISGFLLQTRLYFAIFPSFAIASGFGFREVSSFRIGAIRLSRVVSAMVLLVMLLSLIQAGLQTIQSGSYRFVAGFSNQDEFLKTNLGWYAVAMEKILSLPKDSKVLMLWEPRSLYCLPNCVPDEVIDRWKHDLSVWKTGEAVLAQWRSSGYTHVLLYREGVEFVRKNDRRYTPAEWQALDELLASLPQPALDFGTAYSLYPLMP